MAAPKGGFVPVGRYDGANSIGAPFRAYKADTSTTLAVGDPVIDGSTGSTKGVRVVAQAVGSEGSPSAAIIGVVVGIEPISSDLSLQHLAAASTGYVYVCPAAGHIFACYEDSVGSQLAVTDIARSVDIVVAGASSFNGKSGVLLDSSSAHNSAGYFKIVGLATESGNAVSTSTSAYGKWLVTVKTPQDPGTFTA